MQRATFGLLSVGLLSMPGALTLRGCSDTALAGLAFACAAAGAAVDMAAFSASPEQELPRLRSWGEVRSGAGSGKGGRCG